jgi:integrase/recombinase XerD
MTPLRQKMIDAMQVRGFSVRTHQSYLAAVSALAKYYGRSPEALSREELQAYFLHLVKDRQLSGASCRLHLNGIRFLYLQVLARDAFEVTLDVPRKAQRIPELLTRQEVRAVLRSASNLKHQALLQLCYGCGLRVSELVAVKVRHVDGERHLLRVEQGKGAVDRAVIVSPSLLDHLRRYWQDERPRSWLFPGQQRSEPLGVQTAQRVFTAAKRRAGIEKVGGIHSLRHAYATHQLEAGVPVHQLQRLLGHHSLQSTVRYVHWIVGYRPGDQASHDLLAALERTGE